MKRRFQKYHQRRKDRRVKVREGERCVFVFTSTSKPWRGSLPTWATVMYGCDRDVFGMLGCYWRFVKVGLLLLGVVGMALVAPGPVTPPSKHDGLGSHTQNC